MTLRITKEIYERLQWAVSIRPDLTMTDVINMAMKKHPEVLSMEDPESKSGPVVLNVAIEGVNCAHCMRNSILIYLREQKAKIDARQVRPLELEQCENYTVESIT